VLRKGVDGPWQDARSRPGDYRGHGCQQRERQCKPGPPRYARPYCFLKINHLASATK
jgi:hypothetical protein